MNCKLTIIILSCLLGISGKLNFTEQAHCSPTSHFSQPITDTRISVPHTNYIVALPMAAPKFDLATFEPEKMDCKSQIDYIDECGLQQGYSHRWQEFAYPTNHTHLLSSCKRSADALKCLRVAARCLPPLPKQVLLALTASRQKYNKKICSEKPTEAATKLIEFGQCILDNKPAFERAVRAELNAIIIPEAIVNTKIDSVQDRIKQSCCSVAKVRKEFLDAAVPHCKQYTQVASDLIDSYLRDTVGIICPDFESKARSECANLPKLNTPKSSTARSFIRPIVNVIQTLA